ncbi:MgtC/SapB family protein [Pseudalkalibacillus caeni]|uniref:MgtC/SapB family protein n=1 Tax=Exobacillus caeni TaxID=2574798 RepID=A0A5R9F3W4_9BACL|nr:MgtC/SapB family protein [Pseudalkalibacillus caeni]TLS35553.1 MgtC/SapB family protein [Pseudalkalibacillus caeni]
MQLFHDDFLIMTLRIFIAAILSGIIGLEREVKKHPAGFRTHILVGVGSCLMMLLSLYGFITYSEEHANVRFDPARIPSYVVSGIGFLGAGTILVNGGTVRGLTTAASIWIVAGIGLVVGAGMYAEAVLTTVIVILSLVFLNKIEGTLFKSNQQQWIYLYVNKKTSLSRIIDKVEEKGLKVSQMNIDEEEKKDENMRKFSLLVKIPEAVSMPLVLEELKEIQDVKRIEARE